VPTEPDSSPIVTAEEVYTTVPTPALRAVRTTLTDPSRLVANISLVSGKQKPLIPAT
jgi:hypothetical protein